MALTSATAPNDLNREAIRTATFAETAGPTQSSESAASWGAILAGAAAAAALSLILLLLGVGLGLSAVSPWAHEGISSAAFGISTILWVTFTQLVASGVGGYLAGRLRTKWIAVHTDEVYFRDTAHGFLAWAIASLATAALLTSAIGSIVGTGVKAGTAVVGGAATAAAVGSGAAAMGTSSNKSDGDVGGMGYFIDSLFRKDVNAMPATPVSGSTTVSPTGNVPQTVNAAGPNISIPEITRIFVNNFGQDALPADDVRYIGQVVAQRTGLTQEAAEKRVVDTYARVVAKLRRIEATTKEAADKARKASSYGSLWLFISLLIGAFVASLAATYGGRHRDL